jgi:hypothetical protein
LHRFLWIGSAALAREQKIREVILCQRGALPGGLAVPFRGLDWIGLHAIPGLVHRRQIVLGLHIPLVSRLAIIMQRLGGIPRHAVARRIVFPERKLGFRVAFRGRRAHCRQIDRLRSRDSARQHRSSHEATKE